MNGGRSIDKRRVAVTFGTVVGIMLLTFAIGYAAYAVYFFERPEIAIAAVEKTASTMPSTASTTPAAPASLLFLGDMMFDRSVRSLMKEKGNDYPFRGTKEFLNDFDAVIANLEGPITTYDTVAVPGGERLQFTFPKEVAQELANHNIRTVSLANNHTLNFGAAGLSQTHDFLNDAKVQFFGSPSNNNYIATIKEINGLKIGLVGYHDFAHGLEQVLRATKGVRSQVDFVIVLPHWGDEYQTKPNERQQKIARQFIDAGADMVIGAHPHVRQIMETYKGRKIFYSLGNFIFDQWFSKEVKCGQGIALDISKTGSKRKKKINVEYEVHTFYSERAQPKLDTEDKCI
jgi:gamma-polyglutamate biosynthesis protein CapA